MIHLNAIPGNQTVAYGMDLSEYYLNVEWDILRVPAVRHVKKYPCCPEPYPGTTSKIFISKALSLLVLYGRFKKSVGNLVSFSYLKDHDNCMDVLLYIFFATLRSMW